WAVTLAPGPRSQGDARTACSQRSGGSATRVHIGEGLPSETSTHETRMVIPASSVQRRARQSPQRLHRRVIGRAGGRGNDDGGYAAPAAVLNFSASPFMQ